MTKQLLRLIERGVFPLNDTVVTTYKKKTYVGKIVPTGICYNNIIFESPSGFAAYTRNTHADNQGRSRLIQCSGWTSVFYKGKQLKEYKCKDTQKDGDPQQELEAKPFGPRWGAEQRRLNDKYFQQQVDAIQNSTFNKRVDAIQKKLKSKQRQKERARLQQRKEELSKKLVQLREEKMRRKRSNPHVASSSQPAQKKQKQEDGPLMKALKLPTTKHKDAGKILFKFKEDAVCFHVKSQKHVAYVVTSAILRSGMIPEVKKFHNPNQMDKYKRALNHNRRGQKHVIDRFRRQMEYTLLFVEPNGATDVMAEVDLFTTTASEYFTNDTSRYFHLKRVTLGSDGSSAIVIE